MGRRRTRRSFSDEFKGDAVALVVETGRPIAHVDKELGIQTPRWANWVNRARDAAVGTEPLDEAHARIDQLEAELAAGYWDHRSSTAGRHHPPTTAVSATTGR